MVNKIRWSEDETKYLIENYVTCGPQYCSEKLNKSYNSIVKKAIRLNLKSEPTWLKHDELFLIKNYNNLGAKVCSEKLNKSVESVYKKAISLNLSETKMFWSENEILFLKNNYLNGVKYCSNSLNRSLFSINNKLNEIGLTKQILWSNSDDIFLINNYSKLGALGCAEKLNRSIKSIKCRTNKLKIKLITNNEMINKFKIKHYNFYDYSLVNYNNSKTKIKIICPKHGVFEQLPNSHLSGRGCPICKESKGEKEIRNILENKKINYVYQHKFNSCRNINILPFDFYLPDYNTCIEYHGQQHYKPIKWFGGENGFKKLIKRDKIKENYCKSNNINLIIIIPYRNNILNYINKVF